MFELRELLTKAQQDVMERVREHLEGQEPKVHEEQKLEPVVSARTLMDFE